MKPLNADGTGGYQGRLLAHILLDLELGESFISRNYGVEPSEVSTGRED